MVKSQLSAIETLLNKIEFSYSAIELKGKSGAVMIRRTLTEGLSDYEFIVTCAKAMIFKPLQRESWILAEHLGISQPADEKESVSYWVQTALSGKKEAVWFLYPDMDTVAHHLSAHRPEFSQAEQAEIVAVLAVVTPSATVSFNGDMATVTVETTDPRIVHELISGLGSSRPIYQRGLAWYAVKGKQMTIQLHPSMRQVRATLRHAAKAAELKAKQQLGNWGGRSRSEVLSQAIRMVKEGGKIEVVIRYLVNTFYSGLDSTKATLKLKQAVLGIIPAPIIQPKKSNPFQMSF